MVVPFPAVLRSQEREEVWHRLQAGRLAKGVPPKGGEKGAGSWRASVVLDLAVSEERPAPVLWRSPLNLRVGGLACCVFVVPREDLIQIEPGVQEEARRVGRGAERQDVKSRGRG